MTFRFPGILTLGSALCILSVSAASAQAPGPASQTPQPATSPTLPAQTATPAVAPSAPPTNAVPDYPYPRTLMVGVFLFGTQPGPQPNIESGNAATSYETLTDIGRVHRISPGIEASYPITRTGELHVEVFESKGTGTQYAPLDTTVYTTPISAGDYLATQYQMRNVKFYLDDLLYPHKFPVSRLRVKAIYGIQYIGIHVNINAPLVTAGETADSTANIIYPVFGLAPEYAISKNVLFRIEASGFGFPHRSDIYDAAATLAWRIGPAEIFIGGKLQHFKSSPKGSEYLIGTFDGAFVGARWHF